MKIGFIKLHRKIVEWEWYDNTNVVRVFIHLLLSANHEKNQWHGIDIGIGEVITGRESLAKTLGLSQQSIRTALDKLKSTNEITIKSTNKYSIIKLNNWSSYQGQSTSKITNGQPTANQQSTTLKEVKNDKNEKKPLSSNEDGVEINSLLGLFKAVNPDYQKFYPIQGHRKAIQFLIKEFGAEKAALTIKFLPQLNSMPYAPTVTTPLELRSKLGAIKAFMEKERNKNQKGGVVL